MRTESKKNWIKLCMLFASIFVFQVFANAGTINLPHKYPRTNPNLLTNPTLNGSTSWTLNSGPVYQSTGGRTVDGSGCIKFPSGEDTYAQVKSEMIYDFEYNTPYTVSFYMKTQHEPVYLSACLHMYDANNNRTFSYSTGRVATSTTGEWQEAACVVEISDPNVVKFQVVIEEVNSATYTSDFFIDDVYLGKGISFAEAPVSSRQTFSGSKVTIDELGNWRVYEAGAWKDFFPFGLQPDLNRIQTEYNSLSDQGFNSVFGPQFKSQIQMAANATSGYNPIGLRSGLRLSTYATPGQSYWTLDRLASTITDVNSSLSENLLGYYWDNENNWTTWSLWFDMVDTIRNNDANHPIYINNGYPAVQRLFSKRLSDVCGTYYGPSGAAMESGSYKFDVLQYLQKQDIPASINQINDVENTDYGMRMRVYYSLINGAKGIIWWGDGVTRAETCLWWDDIPDLREEIDQMLPILRQPHWTGLAVTCSDSSILFNTRNYLGQDYMIVINPNSSTVNATFTLPSTFSAMEVRDYFNDAFMVAVSSNNQFTVSLPAHSTAVYKFGILYNGDMEIAGSPIAGWIVTSGQGTVSRDTATKYSGAASCKIVNTVNTQNTYAQQIFHTLKPNTAYRFKARVKLDNVAKQSGDCNGALVQLYAGTGNNMFFPLPGESGTLDWHLVDKTFITPADGTSWYVRLRLSNASGTAWFDDVSIVETNLIANGGMENAGTGAAPADWIAYSNGTIDVSRDVNTKYSGAASCKIVNASILDSGVLQYFSALKPNTTYRFKSMYKMTGVTVGAAPATYDGVVIQLYAGTNIFIPVAGGLRGTVSAWTPLEREFTTPANGTSWYIRLRLWNASGTAWFDNVTLQEVP